VTVTTQADLVAHLASNTTIELGADIYLSSSGIVENGATGIIIQDGQTGLVFDGMGLYKVDGKCQVRCFYIAGAAVEIALQHLTIANGFCVFSKGYAGGFLISGATVALVTCVVTRNTAGRNGGGLHISDSATVGLISCSVSHNSAAHGGGVMLYSGSLMVAGCAFSENHAISGKDLFQQPNDTILTVLSACGDGSFNSGTGTLACYGCTDGPYPANLLGGVCAACSAQTPFTCCGATSAADCEAVEPASCSSDETNACPC
jgi:hypothetical protein